MFSIDITSNDKYYIILKDGKEFAKVNKAINKLEDVKRFFGIEIVTGGGGNNGATN